MEEKKKYNLFFHIILMTVCSVLWSVLAYLIFYYMPFFPQKLLTVKLGPDFIFSFELCYIIGILIAFIGNYILMTKGKTYLYVFKTNCKTPFWCLFFNIAWGSIACFLVSLLFVYTALQAMFIAGIFLFISVVNYFLFFARYGYECREEEYVKNWYKTVIPKINKKGK